MIYYFFSYYLCGKSYRHFSKILDSSSTKCPKIARFYAYICVKFWWFLGGFGLTLWWLIHDFITFTRTDDMIHTNPIFRNISYINILFLFYFNFDVDCFINTYFLNIDVWFFCYSMFQPLFFSSTLPVLGNLSFFNSW